MSDNSRLVQDESGSEPSGTSRRSSVGRTHAEIERIDRRRFLGALAAAVGASLASTGCRTGGADADDARALAQPELLALLGPGAVRAIGLRYRETARAEHDVATLRSRLLARRGWTERLGISPRTPIARLVGDDFAAGEVVVVDGWVLSRTEARQCALFSLLTA